MKTNWGFGSRKRPAEATEGDQSVEQQGRADISEQHGWTAGASMTTRGVVVLLWAALIAGPVALVFSVLAPATSQIIQGTGTEQSDQSAEVSEFAERAVVAWLETPSTDEESLVQYFGPETTMGGRPEFPWRAENPGTAKITKLDNGLWSVTVGVDVTDGKPPKSPDDAQNSSGGVFGLDDPGSSADNEQSPQSDRTSDQPPWPGQGRLYFQLPVLFVNQALVAQALPAPVPPPSTVEPLSSVYGDGLPEGHKAAEMIKKFLEALLVTGDQSELEVYASPGTHFRTISPPGYSDLTIRDIRSATRPDDVEPADGDQLDVQVTVDLVGQNKQALTAQYALTLIARKGRWEISAMDQSPILAEPVPESTPTSVETPASSTTTTPNPNPAQSSSDTSGDQPSDGSGEEPSSSLSPDGQSTDVR
jgi:hypothetical protein